MSLYPRIGLKHGNRIKIYTHNRDKLKNTINLRAILSYKKIYINDYILLSAQA